MIEELKTLVALKDLKTMIKTATYLRVTQSTVSKRIQNLEQITDQRIVIKSGRYIELTDYGLDLAKRAPVVLQEIDDLLLPQPGQKKFMPRLILGIGESILTSGAARSVAKFERKRPETQLVVHSHRAQVIIDRIISGEYHLGLSAYKDARYDGLHFEETHQEPFVIIPSGLKPFKMKRGQPIEVVTIEETAHSWRQIRQASRELGLQATKRLETFFAAAQLAINGFGHGLVPEGTAKALGVYSKCETKIHNKVLKRSIGLYGRKTILERPEAQTLKSIMSRPRN
jgi:DNA-binding transcriptional LysR family regulator